VNLVFREMAPADLPAVLALQAQCYGPEFLESAQAFEAKLRAAAALGTCWLASRAGQPLAYAVSLPLCPETLPALDAPQCALPAEPQLLYLHDMAVAPAGRAMGVARRLLALLEARAQALGLGRMGLVAVQGSLPYWQRHGFAPLQQLPAALQRKLASFGQQARYLERPLLA